MNNSAAALVLAATSLSLAMGAAALPQALGVKRIDRPFDSLGKPGAIDGVLRELGDAGLDRRFGPAGSPAAGGYAVFTYFNPGEWVVGISADGPVLPAGGRPGGTVELEFRDTGRNTDGGGCPYRLRYDLADAAAKGPPPRQAPNPAWWLYKLERRYEDARPGLEVVPLMTRGSSYPALPGATALFLPRPEGGWILAARIRWGDLYGKWPFGKPGAAATWRLRVTRTTAEGEKLVWGANDGEGRVRWPKTGAETVEALCKAMDIPAAIARYEETLARQRDVYMAAERDRHFNHVVTPGPCLHTHDAESSARFRAAVLDKIERDNANLVAAVRPARKGLPPRLFSQPGAIRAELIAGLGRILHVDEAIERGRRDFLRNELLGRKTGAPAAAAPPERGADAPDGPDATWDDADGQIQLDDLAF